MKHNRDTNVNAFHALDGYVNEGHVDALGQDQVTSRSLGDIQQIYDTCGMMGLCPECLARGITNLHQGCQKHYVAGRVRGVAGGD